MGTKNLRSVDGADLGTFETNLHDWCAGMEFRARGNRRMRIEVIHGDTWRVAPVEDGPVP